MPQSANAKLEADFLHYSQAVGDSVKKATGLSMITRSAGVFMANREDLGCPAIQPEGYAYPVYLR